MKTARQPPNILNLIPYCFCQWRVNRQLLADVHQLPEDRPDWGSLNAPAKDASLNGLFKIE
jgi:hypothetical protein